MGILKGKRLLITGVANNKSIAAAIARCAIDEGAEVMITYQNERLKGRVEKIAEELGVKRLVQCDVSSDEQIVATMDAVKEVWPEGFDGLVHSIAFAGTEQLSGSFVDVATREGMALAVDVSAYSLVGLCKAAKNQLRSGGSVVTLTFLGSTRYAPNYNTMGVAKAALESSVRYLAASLGKQNIRVNSISAGPIRTLAASGLANFKEALSFSESMSFLGRSVTAEEVGKTAAFLLSDYASAITAETLLVDAGTSVALAPTAMEASE